MSYVSFGRGDRKLAVIPGLSDGLSTVRGKALLLAPAYRPFLDEYTVYMFSRKNDLDVNCSIREMAGDQAEALEKLGVSRTSVLGVSQGGMIAQYLAADHPELIEKLVLAVTAPSAGPLAQDCVSRWIRFAQDGRHKELMIDTAERSYSPRYLKRYRLLYPLLGRIGRPSDYSRFLANAQAILAFNALEDLKKIACPTLIIGGENDRIVGAEGSRELNREIPDSELYLYPGLGHAAYEEAEDFYERVFRFLSGTKEESAGT